MIDLILLKYYIVGYCIAVISSALRFLCILGPMLEYKMFLTIFHEIVTGITVSNVVVFVCVWCAPASIVSELDLTKIVVG